MNLQMRQINRLRKTNKKRRAAGQSQAGETADTAHLCPRAEIPPVHDTLARGVGEQALGHRVEVVDLRV